MADRAVGSARRRRERRLRAQWRHEQQTVAMALALTTSAQRGEWRDLNEAPRGQRTASAEATYDALRSQTTSVAGDTEFFSLYEEELGGTRPDRLYEVRPQDKVQRRTVEQIVDNTLIVPSLDVLVPQMENQLVEVCRQLDTHVPEQAIEVPKISSTPRHSRRRRVRFAEQTAEQLVEVPTIISYSSLRGIVEQNVDIPVPLGGRQDPDLPSAASSSGLPGTANQGFFFRTFPVLASAYSIWSTLHTATMAASGRLGQALVMRQPTYAIGSISCPLCSCSSHLESGALFPLSLYLAVIVPGVYVLLMIAKIGFFRAWWQCLYNSGYMLCVSTLATMDEFLHVFYVAADSDPEAFFLHSV